MENYKSIDELRYEIKTDKDTRSVIANRYPVRLLFLPSLHTLKDIVKAVDELGIEKVELTKYLPNDDGWLTVDDIIKIVKSLDGNKDFIILPFSEVVRFYDKKDFLSLFNTLSEIENNTNLSRRIFIPLIGIYERFKDEFIDNFHRKNEWAPIWQIAIDNQSRIKIFITDFPVKYAPDIEVVHNTKDWLDLWKKDDIGELICVSNTLSYLYPNRLPDQVFDIEEVKNIKELLSKVYRVTLPIKYLDKDKSFWERLFDMFAKNHFNNLDEAIQEALNIINVGLDGIISLWISSRDKFHKWLLRWYVLSRNEWRHTYIFHIMSPLEDLEGIELLENVLLKIFELNVQTEQLCKERKALLESFKHISITDKLENKLAAELDKINDDKTKLSLLTGIAACEKKAILEMFLNDKIERHALIEKYKSLYYYLDETLPDNLEADNHWVSTYFKEYKNSKLKDAVSLNLNNLLIEKNKSKETFYEWYYTFDTVNSILLKENIDRIIWIDSIGIEWLSFIVNFMENELGLSIDKKYIARANLPSITSCNDFKNSMHILDFDRIIHSKAPYKYPQDIFKQINKLEEILKNNLMLARNEKVAIISDHGTTALARLKENLKTYNLAEAHHDGRCMCINEDVLEDEDFLIYDSGKSISEKCPKSLVALRYTSLYNRPVREVHGGATPEEVLVPIIIISKAFITEKAYEIIPTEVKISRREPILFLSITPQPDKNPLLIGSRGVSLGLEYENIQQKWRGDLKNYKPGKYEMRVKIGEREYPITIEIQGGMRERDLL